MTSSIILLSGVYPPASGGPAIFTERFHKWLKKNGLDSAVVTYSNSIFNGEHDSVIAITPTKPKLLKFVKFVVHVIRNSDKDSIILANGCFLEVLAINLFARRRYILKVPGDPLWERARNNGWTKSSIEYFQQEKLKVTHSILRFLYNKAICRATFVIAPSSQLLQFSHKWGARENRIKLIYNCVDPELFYKSKSDLPSIDIITVCRLVPWKGLAEVILAASKFKFNLTIIGDGPILQELRELALKCQVDVDFVGDIANQDVASYLKRARLFVLNSEFEATAYSLIEAKMAGVPVIARNSAGSTEVINDGIDGILYKSDEIGGLENAISQFGSDSLRADIFSLNAREDALKRFNQDINFLQILDLIQGKHD